MYKLIFSVVAVLFATGSFAQEKKNTLAFSIGSSVASGDFADNKISNTNSGSAGPGGHLYLLYQRKFNKNFGLGVKWFGNSNKLETDAIINELNTRSGVRWQTETTYYTSGGLFLGPTAHISCTEKFIIDFHLFIGFAGLNFPKAKFTAIGLPVGAETDAASSKALGSSFGAGFSYYFNPRWNLLVDLDYTSANFKFDEIVLNFSNGIAPPFSQPDKKQPFRIFNTTIGIGFNF